MYAIGRNNEIIWAREPNSLSHYSTASAVSAVFPVINQRFRVSALNNRGSRLSSRPYNR